MALSRNSSTNRMCAMSIAGAGFVGFAIAAFVDCRSSLLAPEPTSCEMLGMVTYAFGAVKDPIATFEAVTSLDLSPPNP